MRVPRDEFEFGSENVVHDRIVIDVSSNVSTARM